MIEDDLVLSTRLIHGESPSHDDVKPLFQAEPQTNSRRTEDHHSNLTGLVLECTVEMPGPWSTQVRNFPLKPHFGKVGFERSPNHGGQFRDGKNVSRGEF